MIKAVIFDLDNTLEEWIPHEDSVESEMASELAATYHIDPKKFIEVFDMIKVAYLNTRSLPQDYGRDVWFRETLAHFDVFDADIDSLVEDYWDRLVSRVRLFPGAEDVLSRLKKDFAIGMLSDSDGDRFWKQKRIKHLHIAQYFDAIVTSDDVGVNKPHPRGFMEVCDQLGVLTSEAVMVGDHPKVDHIMAKELGMRTVWVREGLDAEHRARTYSYVDVAVNSLVEVPNVIYSFEKE